MKKITPSVVVSRLVFLNSLAECMSLNMNAAIDRAVRDVVSVLSNVLMEIIG